MNYLSICSTGWRSVPQIGMFICNSKTLLFSFFSEDCQELVTNMNRLQARCEAVHVQVHTVRDEGQKQSLEKVNGVLDELHTHVMSSETIPLATVQRARALLNACLPEAVGPIDSRFQSLVLGCAVDDQKYVRQRLQNLVHDCDLETGSRASQPVSHTDTRNTPAVQESNNSSVICDSSQSGVASVPETPASKSNPQSADVGFNNGLPGENYLTAQWYSAPKDSVAKSDNLETQQKEDSVRQTSEKNSENSACQGSDTGSCVPDSVNS